MNIGPHVDEEEESEAAPISGGIPAATAEISPSKRSARLAQKKKKKWEIKLIFS